MNEQIKSILDFIKQTIENVAKASVKAITGNTYKVTVENPSEVKFPETQKVSGKVTVENMPDNTNDFLEIARSLDQLSPLLRKIIDKKSTEISNLKDIKIPSKIEVLNPVKEVKVNNLDALFEAVQKVQRAIEDLPKEFPEINIPETKIPDFPKFPEIKFPKIPEFPKEISVKDLQKLIKIAEKITSRDPKDPIAVRLSDGKEFYEAITEIIGATNQSPFQQITGTRDTALIDKNRHQVVAIGDRFNNNDVDVVSDTTQYIGAEDVDGNWMIQKVTQSGSVTSFRYATNKNNTTKKTYAGAWSARLSLSYGKVSEAL